jgi:putative Holliday junction resolvase
MRVLAVDYGRRRIGLAYSDPTRTIVSHCETITVANLDHAANLLTAYIKENEISLVVLGIPVRQDGSEGDIAEEVRILSEALSRKNPEIGIDIMNERYTSKMAERLVHSMGLKIGDDKGKVDALAASVLLEDYLSRPGIR